MSTTVLRTSHGIDWEVPPAILHHRPGLGEVPSFPEESGVAPPTYLHPAAVITAAAGYGWFLLVFWVVLGGNPAVAATLGMATLVSGAMLGLLSLGGVGGRNVAPGQRPWRSFPEFLAGEVEVWGARMSGREAFIHLASMAWALAALATAFGIIIALSRP